MGYLIWWRKFQDSIAFRLWHGYFQLLLAKFIVITGSKKQSKQIKTKHVVWPEKESLKVVDKEGGVVKELLLLKRSQAIPRWRLEGGSRKRASYK
jgi:hypothetical protein